MEGSPPIKPPRGVKPGKETSGLLMSVIRTLSASETNEQRDTEKLKIEEEFRRSDKKLDELVSTHDQDLTKVMQLFGSLSAHVNESRENIRRVKENLEACKVLLHCRRDELKKLWFEGLEYKYMLQLLEEIEQMTEVPNKLAAYLARKHYLHATQLLVGAVSLGKGSLEGVEGIRELSSELDQKKQELYAKLIEELRVHLYVRPCQEVAQLRRQGSGREIGFQRGSEQRLSNRQRQIQAINVDSVEDTETGDPEADSNHFIAVLVRCLALLERLPATVDTIRRNMHFELQRIAHRSALLVQQQQRVTQNGSAVLLELIHTLFDEFRAVVRIHSTLLSHLQRYCITPNTFELYDVTEVWSRVQDVIKQLLADHLDIQSLGVATDPQLTVDYNDANDLNTFFSRKKAPKKKVCLFKFDGSSSALTSNESATATTGSRDKTLVCAPDSNHVTTVFVPMMRFVEEVEQATGSKPCALNVFLAEYVTEKFLAQRRSELQAAVEAAANTPDAWRLTRPGTSTEPPLLICVVVVERHIAAAAQLLHALPLHGERVLRDTTVALRDFRDAARSAYHATVHSASLSAAWLRDDDISRFLQSLPNWLELKSDRYQQTADEESPEAVQQRNVREADMLASNLGEAGVGAHEILADSGALRGLALLHKALEWLADRVQSLARELRHEKDVAVSAASLQALATVAGELEELANRCLLVLHLEVRVQCFHYLLRVDGDANQGDDVEPRVLELGRALAAADDALSGALHPRKCRYVFEGLGHLVSNVLISSTTRMARADAVAIQHQCRNVLALQQALAAVTLARDPALDRARRYFELLCLSPDDLLATVLEKGPEFSQLEYANALQLLGRTHGLSDVHTFLDRLNDILHNVSGVTV